MVDALAIAFVFAAVLAWTWLKWPDPLIDFGRDLYLAWQFSEGKLLYRDIEHFNGPLSVWFNAGLFSIFGRNLHVIAYANIVITAIMLVLIHALVRRFACRFAATACCITFATLFACMQFVDVGNYNFITPYSHEITHGIALALGAIWCLSKWTETGRVRFAVLCGALLGLIWLTKFEVFIAAFGAVGIGMVLVSPRRHVAREGHNAVAQTFLSVSLTRRDMMRSSLAVFLTMVWIPIAAFIALAIKLPAADAFRGVMGSAYHVFDSRLTSLPFYRQIAGFNDVGANLTAMFTSAAVIGVVLLLQRQFLAAGNAKFYRFPPWLAAVVPPALAFAVGSNFPWHLMLRGLPLLLLGLLAIECWRWRRGKIEVARCARIVWLVFGLLLLAKIPLAAQLQHYGFALAMPGTLAIVAALVSPRSWFGTAASGGKNVSIHPWPAAAARALGVSVVATVILLHLEFYSRRFAEKPIEVGSGANRFLAAADRPNLPSRGAALAALLPQIEAIVPKNATLAAIPEGAMINFLTGRRNPTPFVTLLPPEFIMFKAERIVEAYRKNPPDFIVVVPTDVSQYGSKGFARDYGASLAAWIGEHYDDVPTDTHFSYPMRLLRRKGL